MIWSDEEAVQVLRNCAAVLPRDGTVLAIEMIMPQGKEPSAAPGFDVLMMLAHKGGRIMTEAEFHELFGAAGLRVMRIAPTGRRPTAFLRRLPRSPGGKVTDTAAGSRYLTSMDSWHRRDRLKRAEPSSPRGET